MKILSRNPRISLSEIHEKNTCVCVSACCSLAAKTPRGRCDLGGPSDVSLDPGASWVILTTLVCSALVERGGGVNRWRPKPNALAGRSMTTTLTYLLAVPLFKQNAATVHLQNAHTRGRLQCREQWSNMNTPSGAGD